MQQTVYEVKNPTGALAVYTNPAQKLILYGNVYVLTEQQTYTITGYETIMR